MKICSIDELKEHDILARDVLSDGYNVFLYKNTILNKIDASPEIAPFTNNPSNFVSISCILITFPFFFFFFRNLNTNFLLS